MQPIPRLSANLLVILVRIPGNQEVVAFTQGTVALSGDVSRYFCVCLRGSELLMPWLLLGDPPLSRPLLSPPYYPYRGHSSPRCNYRFLPNFTDVYRSFGLSWETSAIKNYHSQDSLFYFFSTTPLSYSYFTDLSDFLARIESCQLISVVGRVDS